jgi:hypothetical protein
MPTTPWIDAATDASKHKKKRITKKMKKKNIGNGNII